ncbi:acyltransferase family protein [Larkinella insperata]|uniref:Acyltransferase family protein n=1 Tax=Larkinella insperata TaxID=332158 RepID=A0ABW3QLQ8_9BACT|nr:acyltransferase [Larkinella insperata]
MILRPTHSVPQTFQSIQALRAVAALLVTFFHLFMVTEQVDIHLPLLRCFKAGFGGVDLFFIISGFIITHTNFSKINRPEQFLPYLKKRLGRIYAIYWPVVILAGIALIGIRQVAPSLQWLPYSFDPVDLLKTLTLIPAHDSPLPVTWSLSFELYFYGLFGLVIISRTLLILPAFVLAATLYTSLVNWAGIPHFGWLQYFLFSPFNLEFGLGIVAYWLVRRYSFRIPPIVLGVALFIFLLTGEFVKPSDAWLRVWGFGVPTTILLLSVVQREIAGRTFCPAWLLKQGDASYILYLIHVPAFMVMTHALLMLHLVPYVLPANLLLVGLLCWASWQLHQHAEKPILRWLQNRLSGPTTAQYSPDKRYRLQVPASQPQPAS